MSNYEPVRNNMGLQQTCSDIDQQPSTSRLIDQPNNLPPALPRTLEEDLNVSSSSSDLYEPSGSSPSGSSDTENESPLESDLEGLANQKRVSTKKKKKKRRKDLEEKR